MGLRRLLCRSRLTVICFLFIGLYMVGILWTSRMKSEGRELHSVNDYVNMNDEHFAIKNQNDQNVGQLEKIHFSPKCKEKKNLVFIKCMKCATETMGTIIRRFGYTRNLSFVTPRMDKLYLGWPFLMNKYDYRPSSRGYNIIMEHSIYDKTFMEKLMPKDTVYISIIREPFSHVKSSIHYFKIIEIAKVPGIDPLSEYFQNIEKYDAVYKSPESSSPRYCIPNGFSITKNLLSHCLGMPTGFPSDRKDITHDPSAVQDYIDRLGQDFSLIMLVEYFDESLILLKRKMCWTFYDIVFKSANSGEYSYKRAPPDPELVSIYKKWSPADYALYDHFNKTFWKQVQETGSDFFEEVAEYRKIQTRIRQFCGTEGELTVESSKWSPGFTMNGADCKMLDTNLLKKIQERHDIDEKTLLEKNNLVLTQNRPQSLC